MSGETRHNSRGATILAVDIGQTGFRLQVGAGEVLEGPYGIEALTEPSRIRALSERIAAAVSPDADFASVGVGLSGFVTGSSAPGSLAVLLQEALGGPRVAVAADAVTAYLGTIGGTAGTIVICGTGVAALGADAAGAYHRVDARGYLLGDFGSGFWIGQRGLQAALDALEGRNPETVLSGALTRLGTPADVYHAAMSSTPAPKYVAAFAIEVLRAAEAGDSIALRIVSDAGDEIARTALTARVGGGPIGLTGGLTRSPVYTDAVLRSLQHAGIEQPQLIIRPDAALDGARLLAEHQHARGAFPGLIEVKEQP